MCLRKQLSVSKRVAGGRCAYRCAPVALMKPLGTAAEVRILSLPDLP